MQNIMRPDAGVSGDIQKLETISWMLFLKIWDSRELDLEFTQENFTSPLINMRWMDVEGEEISPDLRWRTWASNPEGITGQDLINFVNIQLFPALKNIIIPTAQQDSQENHREHLTMIKNSFSESLNYMVDGICMRKLINYINSELDYSTTKGRTEFGKIYESFLQSVQAAGDAGEYYTPRGVIDFMINRLDPKLGESLLDPAAGTGGFLCSAIDWVREKYVNSAEDLQVLENSMYGIEKKQLPHLLGITNLLHHGITQPYNLLKKGNTLAKPISSYNSADQKMIIATNPPFGGSEHESVQSNFPNLYRASETADLFMSVIHRSLHDNGRAAIIYPETPEPTGAKKNIVQRILEECNLHTIVKLPDTTFQPYAKVATNILFFEKGAPTTETWFYEHTLPDGYKSYSKTRPIQFKHLEPILDWWDARKENEFAWKVTTEQIIDANYAIYNWKNPHFDDSLEEYQTLYNRGSELSTEIKQLRIQLLDLLNKSIE
jgi:type I restriction enzyme M protein